MKDGKTERGSRPSSGAEARDGLERGASIVLGRALTPRETGQLLEYCELIRSWSRVHRLVGSTDIRWLVDNVVVDSLRFAGRLPVETRSLVDIGAGVGAPGVPIAVVRPDLHIVLAEARRRRASFLATAIRELGLPRCEVFAGRAEELGERRPRQFDVAVSRCAGPPVAVRRIAVTLVKPGGILFVAGAPAERGGTEGFEWIDAPGWPPGTTRRLGIALLE